MIRTGIPDLDERNRALDPTRSLIVQAPAGSGKTELLIQRYLMLLAHVDHPEEVVAITFTRKAAGEMRARVLAALDAAQSGRIPATEHERLTLELATRALQRDSAASWSILDNPARLRIQTIDSLCASLTRQMPILSRFGGQPESIEDASELYLEAARTTIALVESDEKVAPDLERLLMHLDNNVARIETLLADMLARRDHWIRINLSDREQLEGALSRVRCAALERVLTLLPAKHHDELLELARYAAANLAAVDSDSPIVACHELAAMPGADEAAVTAWCGLGELLLRPGDGEWRKQHNVRHGFPAGKTKADKLATTLWKNRISALVEELRGNDVLRKALHELRRLPRPSYTDDQWQVLGAILRLLPRAVGELTLVFQSRGQVDFTEVSQSALRALATEEGPTDLALALDYRMRHLLIDEFQDTSISQSELVARLIGDWQWDESRTGRSVFVVGDPMQSIYRFREAEVGLFLRARTEGIGGLQLESVGLSANFRSQAGLVAWVNATFVQMMPRHENIATGAVPYTASVATLPPLEGIPVDVHPFFNDDKVGEAERVVKIVADARRDDGHARIAILVRSRGHLREIVPRLRDAGLRFRAIDIEELGHRPVVQDLIALTRALSHPADRMAWLALLRAPWCGLTLADLHALAGNDHVRTVWELMCDDARAKALSANGRARLQRVNTVLQTCFAQRGRGALRERIAGAWFALGGPACVADSTDLEDAEIYFEHLEANDEAGEIADPVAFEEGLTKLYALPDLQADESLQIMTLHKAKGLEFDVVIVPGLGRRPRGADPKLFLWTEQPRNTSISIHLPSHKDGERSEPFSLNGNAAGAGSGSDLLIAPIEETGADSDPTYAWLQKLEAEKDSLEAERLLYVAATRAKRRLHLLGDTRFTAGKDGVLELKPPPGNVLLGKLWSMVEPIYAEAARGVAPPEAEFPSDAVSNADTRLDQSLRRLVSGWELPPAPVAAAWTPPRDTARDQDELEFSWSGETARHVGSVVHRWLQRIAENGLAGWDEKRIAALRGIFREELAVRGLPVNECGAASARVAAALVHAVTDARGRWLLGPQLDASNEHRITAIIAGVRMNLVIDRTFRDTDGKRWIVDYKTSAHEGADVVEFLDRERVRYQPQLARYALAIGGTQATVLGLYFPLLAGWREWEK